MTRLLSGSRLVADNPVTTRSNVKKQEEERFVFMVDRDRSITGFDTIEAAHEAAAKIEASDDVRVRVRLRRRTDKFDVVVKVRTPVKKVTAAVASALAHAGAGQ